MFGFHEVTKQISFSGSADHAYESTTAFEVSSNEFTARLPLHRDSSVPHAHAGDVLVRPTRQDYPRPLNQGKAPADGLQHGQSCRRYGGALRGKFVFPGLTFN